MKTKITLIHPSRGRAEKALQTYEHWIKNSSGSETIEIDHILSIDSDDKAKDDYYFQFRKNKCSTILCVDNSDVVAATNKAAMYAGGDILVYLSDDFKCPVNWDKEIFKSFCEKKYCSEINLPRLLKVDDLLQNFNVPVLTIPIMTMALYKKLGYFWHPGYKSMFVDEDLYWTCKNNEWLILCPELVFPHEHPANGKAPNDETYRRSAGNWDQGKDFFAKRKSENFPL